MNITLTREQAVAVYDLLVTTQNDPDMRDFMGPDAWEDLQQARGVLHVAVGSVRP